MNIYQYLIHKMFEILLTCIYYLYYEKLWNVHIIDALLQ